MVLSLGNSEGCGCWGWGFLVLLIGSFIVGVQDGDWSTFLLLFIPSFIIVVVALNQANNNDESASATKSDDDITPLIKSSDNSIQNSISENYDNEYDNDDDDDLDNDDDEDDLFGDRIDHTDYEIQVTADEFNDIKASVKELLKLCHLISANREMRQYLFERANDKNTIEGEYDMDKFYDTLKLLLAKDIAYVYEHLGFDVEINLFEPEGQLLLAIVKTLQEDYEANNYKSFRELIKYDDGLTAAMRDNYEDMLDIYKNQTDVKISAKGFDEFSLVLIIVYSRQEKRYLKKTRNALFHFARTVIDITGENETSKAFLKDLIERAKDDEEDSEKQDNKDETDVKAEPLGTMEDLQEMIGLNQVKKEITELKNFIEVNRRREEAGMKTPPISYHCVFTGNPGTGKTTVARIVAGIYKELGILQKGHLVETDRSGLVAEYVGQTAVKTNKVIDSALDGVLFIDEAYSLVGAGNEDFGKEAIATLVKRMEDNRDRLVVILAGYEDEMQQFIESNPGLRSRFNRYIHFEDYTAEELEQIFLSMLQRYDYVLQDEGEQALRRHFEQCVANKGKDFGNARYVRNLFERSIKAQSVRLAAQTDNDKTQLATIIADDITSAIADKP